jgi:hypothetical protein
MAVARNFALEETLAPLQALEVLCGNKGSKHVQLFLQHSLVYGTHTN